ncbi:hypothetical protein H5T87_05460 [bacterium]|nr:hypothetical protein [bacterium]
MPLRLLGKDVTVLQAGTNNIVALYERAIIELESQLLNISSIKDDWALYAVSRKGWRVRLLKLLESAPLFPTLLQEASEVNPLTIQCQITIPGQSQGVWTFSGEAIPAGASLDMQEILREEIVLQGLGSPLIS